MRLTRQHRAGLLLLCAIIMAFASSLAEMPECKHWSPYRVRQFVISAMLQIVMMGCGRKRRRPPPTSYGLNFGVRRLAAALESWSNLPHSKKGRYLLLHKLMINNLGIKAV